ETFHFEAGGGYILTCSCLIELLTLAKLASEPKLRGIRAGQFKRFFRESNKDPPSGVFMHTSLIQ
ncbi:hypothetical protein M8C21_028640, partial [Ambrosia artemisiifolia]